MRSALRAIVSAALASVDRRPGQIGVVLTDDGEMRTLNQRWRKLDRTTDVLSFGYDPDARGTRVNGDLVVSVDRVHEQAKRFRVTPGRELARLVIHGTLHLAGLDHQTAAERRVMRRHEAAVLRKTAAPIAVLDRAIG